MEMKRLYKRGCTEFFRFIADFLQVLVSLAYLLSAVGFSG